jgi:hypothetical protein
LTGVGLHGCGDDRLTFLNAGGDVGFRKKIGFAVMKFPSAGGRKSAATDRRFPEASDRAIHSAYRNWIQMK